MTLDVTAATIDVQGLAPGLDIEFDLASGTVIVVPDGDFDDDGDFDGDDIDLLVAHIANGTNDLAFDLTADGLVNLADRDKWLARAGAVNLPSGNSYLLGDANLDGFVDGLDFIIWNSNKFTATPAWTAGDFNADGVVDGQDFIVWNTNKFMGAAAALRNPVDLHHHIHDRIWASLSQRQEELTGILTDRIFDFRLPHVS
jgi:hypothetical protein